MFLLTKKKIYIDQATMVAEWILNNGIVTTEGAVYDGIMAPSCTIGQIEVSYSAGMTAGAFSYLYQATLNPKYIALAGAIFTRSVGLFTKDYVWVDSCEASTTAPCALDSSQPKGTAIIGFMYFYMQTKDQVAKALLKRITETSAASMLTLCDSHYSCPNIWMSTSPAKQPTSFHSQLTATALMNSVIVVDIGYSLAVNSIIPSLPPTGSPNAPTQSSESPNHLGWFAYFGSLVATCLLL